MEYILNDNPVCILSDDKFNFSHYADKVNTIIQNNTDNSECMVIGIHGRWGDGKTSFMNLIKCKLAEFKDKENNKRVLKYEFNPWRYSNEDEMLFDFFDGLSKKLMIDNKENFKKAGKYIKRFGRYLKAIKLSASVGILNNNAKITFEPHRVLEALGEDLEGEEITLEKIKSKIDIELGKSDYKIAIYIDDLDRLDKDEIYTLLKIIKLNANFKNLIYLITLDPSQIAKAIHHRYGNNKKDGKSFLEKIITIPIVLPRIEKEDFKLFFESKLEIVIKNLKFENKDEEFKEILDDYYKTNFKSPREIIRLLNSFFISAFAIGNEVNLTDLFWIEYLKISDEKCYNKIKNYDHQPNFTFVNGIIDFNDEFGSRSDLNGFRKNLFDNHKNSSWIINNLFPPFINVNNININEIRANSSNGLKINSTTHFEKYFSYHTVRKISEVYFNEFLRDIKEDKYEIAYEKIQKLRKDLPYNLLVQRLRNVISESIQIDFNIKYYLFISKYYKYIYNSIDEDIFGRNDAEKIFESIAKNLDSKIGDYENVVIEIANNLDAFTLCHFARKFNNSSKKMFDLLIIEKVKLQEIPFYENPAKAPNKMIMQIWNNLFPEEFENFIKSSLNKNNVKLLIRNFPGFWNNSYFGGLTQDNYNFMKSIIDVEVIHNKIVKYYPEFNNNKLNKDRLENVLIDEMDENSIDDNVRQFIYWYKIDHNMGKS